MTNAHPFDKHYFHGGARVGGYAGAGYRDFPVHWNTYARVMERTPASVLELGCGRGYVLKRCAAYGKIPAVGLEISEHCYLTRAHDAICSHDVTCAPWPVADRDFDLCVSVAFLEHVPEDELPRVFAEMERTCARGLHGIDIDDRDHFDQTHCTIRPLAWWRARLPKGHEAIDKEDLESGALILPNGIYDGLKLNLGSHTHMFHGWRNLDRGDLGAWAMANGYGFSRVDLRDGIPYDDGIVDLIFLSHVLEHFSYDDGARLLRECRRTLKPGGIARIAVPDTGALARRFLAGTIDDLGELCGADGLSGATLFHELLYGGDHRALYDEPALLRAVRSAGFARGKRVSFGHSASVVMQRETIDLYPEISLFVEAIA